MLNNFRKDRSTGNVQEFVYGINVLVIRVIKSRRMRWAGPVARMGEKKNTYRILVGKPEGKRPLEDQSVDGWTISKWILER
jgi:hypothetical protein